MIPATIRVKDENFDEGFRIIDKADFDPATMSAFDAADVTEETDPVKGGPLPALNKLKAYLETLEDESQVEILSKRDDREKAAPLYAARLKALTKAG